MIKLGFVSAILADQTFEQVVSFAARTGYSCVEIMCWPRGKAERRYAGVTHIDADDLDPGKIDAVRRRLDEKGVADNTLVIYVADNGWIQKPSGGYAPRSKRSPYEGGTRTPIMFRWPGRVKPADRPELCSSIDIVPTILAAAGAEIPKRLPGLNLLPNLQQGTPLQRNAIYPDGGGSDGQGVVSWHDAGEDILAVLVTHGGELTQHKHSVSHLFRTWSG